MQSTEQTQAPEVVDQAGDMQKKTPQQSFAELREANKDLENQLWQARKEKELFEKQMQMQAQYQQKPQAPQEDEYDYRQLEKEEFPDGKNLVKAFNQFNKQLNDKDKKLAETQQKLLYLETVQGIKDFDEVVTAENIEKYIKSDEDNREGVEKAANPLRKAYNLIKKDARYLADQARKSPATSQEQKRVEDKESKPAHGSIGVRSAAVTTAAILSNSQMSKEYKAQIWKETQQFARKR